MTRVPSGCTTGCAPFSKPRSLSGTLTVGVDHVSPPFVDSRVRIVDERTSRYER